MNRLDVSELALLLIGAFYTFAGLVGIRAALQGRFFDLAIAAISMKPVPRFEVARGLWMLVSSFLVLAGGLFLVLRLDWAAWAFVASAASQALYLLLLAPKFFDPEDPPDARGRQQTVNAFILYAAATAFVLWAARTGRLLSAESVGWPYVLVALALLAAATIHGLVRFGSPLSRLTGVFGGGRTASAGAAPAFFDEEEETPTRPPHESRRILVMAEYDCDPLWSHDSDLSGTISPRDLPLSMELIADLEAWGTVYASSFNMEDLSAPHWTEDQYAAHAREGVELARRLKRELPDRQIFVWNDGRHMEIPAEGPA